MPPEGGLKADALVLAVDQGTTNTKAVLVDPRSGTVVSRASVPVGISFPRPGWVEQDADRLWSTTLAAIQTCLASRPDAPLVGVAVSNQRESVVTWSRSTGRPLGPVLGWQDARTDSVCDALARQGLGSLVRRRTGLSLDPMYSATKMRWLLDQALADGHPVEDVLVGTVDAWLVHNLTGGEVIAIEAGNASRTLLLDLAGLDWDVEMLEVFGVPRSCLPEVRASDAGFGRTVATAALPAGVPIVAVLADSHSALYHHGCTAPGATKVTYGTGSSVMTPCAGPDEAPAGIATTLAWLTDTPTYAREGNIIATGAAVDWLAEILDLPGGDERGPAVTALAGRATGTPGIHFVPAFSGLGAPYWDRTAQSLLVGFTGGTSRAQMALAALESVAHQVVDVVDAIEADGGARVATVLADGGATSSALLMQLQADLLGRPVHVADVADASASGVAAMAARRLGFPTPSPASADAAGPGGTGRTVPPDLDEAARSRRRHGWQTAVRRSRGLAVHEQDPPSRPAPRAIAPEQLTPAGPRGLHMPMPEPAATAQEGHR